MLERDKQVNFKVNSAQFEAAKDIFRKRGMDVTTVFNLFIAEVVARGDLPFKTVKEKERDEILEDLYHRIKVSERSLKEGRGMTIDEAKASLFGSDV